MNKHYLACLLAGVTAIAVGEPQAGHKNIPTPKTPSMEFIANKGQWDSHVKFLGRSPGVDMWITDKGVTYSYHRTSTTPAEEDSTAPIATHGPYVQGQPQGIATRRQTPIERLRAQVKAQMMSKAQKPARHTDGHIVRVAFVGAGDQTKTYTNAKGKKNYYYNFFQGKDKTKWASHVPVYSSVKVNDIYKGVDLVAYYDPIKKRPRYDLVVKPGADASKIAMRYDGAEDLRVNAKGLVSYNTSLGKVEERDLYAYQPKAGHDIDANRMAIAGHNAKALAQVTPVEARMAMSNDGLVHFKVGKRNASNALVIDPLIWATYLDGSSSDVAGAITAGPDDSIYVAGNTYSPDYPLTPGAFQTSTGDYDCGYFSRLSPDGSHLLYSTFFGGDSYVAKIMVQSNGSVAIAGASANPAFFPLTEGAYFNGSTDGDTSAYVIKFSPDGSSLVYSTFFAPRAAAVYGAAIDGSGAVYVTGALYGQVDALGTPGSAYPTYTPTPSVSYCAKLLPDGSNLAFSTFLPGSYATALALDANQNIYITGQTDDGFVATTGAYQTSANLYSAFVTKLHSDGTQFDYSTIVGPASDPTDNVWSGGYSIAVDSTGAAFVFGSTSSQLFPTSDNAYCRVLQVDQPGDSNSMLFKVNPDGSNLDFSTYFGINGAQSQTGIVLDSQGHPIVCGYIYNGHGTVPTTPGALRSTPGLNSSSFVSKFSSNASQLLYSTYLGSPTSSATLGMALLSNEDVATLDNLDLTNNYPTTGGAFQVLPPDAPGGAWSRQGISRLGLYASASLSISPNSGPSTTPFSGTVTLPFASATDTKVTVQSASDRVAVPRNLTIPAGQLSVNFPIKAKIVDVVTQIDIRATINGVTDTKFITIDPPVAHNFWLSKDEVGANLVLSGKIELTAPAGPSGVTLTITNSDPSVATAPATVIVPSGKTTVSFPIQAGNVSSKQTTTITATDSSGNVIAARDLTVDPLEIVKLSAGGSVLWDNLQHVQGSITLNGAAPEGGLEIALDSSDYVLFGFWSGPTVTIPAGATTASIDENVGLVLTGTFKDVTVSASYGGKTLQTVVTVKRTAIASVTLSTSKLYSGYTTVATVKLNHVLTQAGYGFNLHAIDPATGKDILFGGGEFTIWAGDGSMTIPLSLEPFYSGPATKGSLVVTSEGSRATQTIEKPFTISPLKLSSMTVANSTVKAGDFVYVTVTLNAPAPADQGAYINLNTSLPIFVGGAKVPAGAQSATLKIPTMMVPRSVQGYLTASLNGVSKTVKLLIRP